MKDSGSLPNVSTYTNLMQQLFRVKEFQEAMNLYSEMTEMGVKLDNVAATTVVAASSVANESSPEKSKAKSIGFCLELDLGRFEMDLVQSAIWPILSERDKGALDLWVKEFQEAMNLYSEMTEMGVKLDNVAATTVVAASSVANESSPEKSKAKSIGFCLELDLGRFEMDLVQSAIWPILSERDKGALDLWHSLFLIMNRPLDNILTEVPAFVEALLSPKGGKLRPVLADFIFVSKNSSPQRKRFSMNSPGPCDSSYDEVGACEKYYTSHPEPRICVRYNHFFCKMYESLGESAHVEHEDSYSSPCSTSYQGRSGVNGYTIYSVGFPMRRRENSSPRPRGTHVPMGCPKLYNIDPRKSVHS
ncbi:hypothetical protein BC332_25898 [Capsicum chinense]|nr:hypothetical protein BC332_25898 [Capsicum chinense]